MVGQIAKKKNSLSYILFDDFKNTRAEKYFQECVLYSIIEEEKIMKRRKRNPRLGLIN